MVMNAKTRKRATLRERHQTRLEGKAEEEAVRAEANEAREVDEMEKAEWETRLAEQARKERVMRMNEARERHAMAGAEGDTRVWHGLRRSLAMPPSAWGPYCRT